MNSEFTHHKSRPCKVLIIDPNIDFGQKLLMKGQSRGYLVDYYRSVVELSSQGRLHHYDVAILSIKLGCLAGFELAHYSDRLLRKTPLIIVADHSEQVQMQTSWPQSAFKCHLKDDHPDAILDSVETAFDLIHDYRHKMETPFEPEQSAS
jgi:DNA-binding NtrC family response regulator